MAFKLDIRSFIMGILFSLVTITILSLMLSQFTNLETIQTGKAFLIIFIAVFLAVIFLAAYDKKIEKNEIVTLIIVAVFLTGSFIALKNYVPEIFSIFPEQVNELFGALN